VIIVAYVRCCIALKHPAPRLSQLKHDVVELVAQDILPMLEKGSSPQPCSSFGGIDLEPVF